MHNILLVLFRTGQTLNHYDYMKFPVNLWLSYGSFMAHLGQLVQSGEMDQLIYVTNPVS